MLQGCEADLEGPGGDWVGVHDVKFPKNRIKKHTHKKMYTYTHILLRENLFTTNEHFNKAQQV